MKRQLSLFDIFSIILLVGFIAYGFYYLNDGDVLIPGLILLILIIGLPALLIYRVNKRNSKGQKGTMQDYEALNIPVEDSRGHRRTQKEKAAAEAVAEIHEIVERMETYTNDIHDTVAYMRGETKELPPDRPVPRRDAEILIDPNDNLEDQVISYILQSQTTTLSAIQRKFKLGQIRAWHIMDSIEELGIIGPQIGSLPREIKVSYEMWLDKRSYYEALRMERSEHGENRRAPEWEL